MIMITLIFLVLFVIYTLLVAVAFTMTIIMIVATLCKLLVEVQVIECVIILVKVFLVHASIHMIALLPFQVTLQLLPVHVHGNMVSLHSHFLLPLQALYRKGNSLLLIVLVFLAFADLGVHFVDLLVQEGRLQLVLLSVEMHLLALVEPVGVDVRCVSKLLGMVYYSV